MDAIETMVEKERLLKQAEIDYKGALIQAQLTCTHPKIVEGSYRPEGLFIGTLAPFRVCTCCGYAEQGWHCGYSFLNGTEGQQIPTMERDKAEEYVRGGIIPNEEHSEVKFGRKKLEKLLRENIHLILR